MHYQGQTVEFDVLVSPRAAINDEYLKQEITSAQRRKETIAYTFADAEKQAALAEKLDAAKAILENHDASQEAVNQALNDLKQAGADLDGNQRYQTAREELESLLESVLEKDPQSELIAQAEALLSSQTPTPEAFADMKEKLNKKLASAEESHHVGSLEEGETTPTVEVLPELVVETETQAFERQERPSGDLLVGERRIVQAGVEGQTRRLIEVDAKGNRTLLETEVVKEAVAEITEVSTKVENRVQPLDGPKVLEVKKPSLVVEEEVLAYGHEEGVNPSLPLGERRLVQVGVAGLRRNLVEIDSEGHRSLKGTEVLKEAVTEIVEVGTKIVKVPGDRPVTPAPATQDIKKETRKTEPKTETSVSPVQASQAAKQEPAKTEAQVEKPEGKQLPSTGTEVDANLLALGLAGVLSGFGLLAQKKKED